MSQTSRPRHYIQIHQEKRNSFIDLVGGKVKVFDLFGAAAKDAGVTI